MTKLFNSLADARHAEEKLREQFGHLPFTSFYVSTLGGEENASLLFTLSLDQKELWANKILENARHAKFHLQANGKLEKISGSKVADFRGVRVSSVQQAIEKLWIWLEKSRTEGAPKRYGVYKWRGDARYTLAVKEYRSEKAAEKFAKKMNDANPDANMVVRTVNPVPLAKGAKMKRNPDYTARQFQKDLKEPYAWPGGYPRFFLTSDGEVLSFKDAEENKALIIDAIKSGDDSGWRVVAVDINWEDENLYSDHSGDKIESAYGENPVPLAKGTKIKRAVKRKVSPKQIAARKLFAKRAKAGTFRKKAATKKRASVRKPNPTPIPSGAISRQREDIKKQARRLAGLLRVGMRVEEIEGVKGKPPKYQISHPDGSPMSLILYGGDLKTWLHGAIQSALLCGRK